jgi:ubiquinone/menaquinone biosynthesis C-methylase UbiE
VVELGAGTGEIGLHLSRLPIRYVGLDASAPMLRQFHAKAIDGTPSLILADGDHAWPLREGVAAVVVASRVIHLLDPEHVTRETLRVGRRAGFLILGRVVRERASIKERLRRRRQELLVEAGVTPFPGEAGTRDVVARCVAAGAESLDRWVVAEWISETTPAEVIAGWESLSRMGSVPIDPDTRTGIVDKIRSWARVEIGDLERPKAFCERYIIDGVRLPQPYGGYSGY